MCNLSINITLAKLDRSAYFVEKNYHKKSKELNSEFFHISIGLLFSATNYRLQTGRKLSRRLRSFRNLAERFREPLGYSETLRRIFGNLADAPKSCRKFSGSYRKFRSHVENFRRTIERSEAFSKVFLPKIIIINGNIKSKISQCKQTQYK